MMMTTAEETDKKLGQGQGQGQLMVVPDGDTDLESKG